MIIIRTIGAALCAAAITTQSQTPASPPPREPVSLTFAWPVGLTATIESERSKVTVMDGKRTASSVGLRYRMRVDSHPEGRLISFDNFEPLGATLTPGEAQGVEEFMTSLMPSLVVGNDGRFVRVGDLTNIRAALTAFIDAVKMKSGSTVPAGAQAILDRLTSEEVLGRLASADWQIIVGAFVGFAGRVGAPEEFDSQEPSPVIPDLEIPMRTTFGALQRVPCEAGRPPDSCIVMQVRSVMAPGGMAILAKRLLAGVKDLEGLKYERFDVVNEVLSVIEPSTLKPYRITHTKSVEFTMSMPGQGTASGTQSEEKIYRIRYAR